MTNFILPTALLETDIRERNRRDRENSIQTKIEIEQTDLDAIERVDRENKERLIRDIVDPAVGLTVNDQITL